MCFPLIVFEMSIFTDQLLVQWKILYTHEM